GFGEGIVKRFAEEGAKLVVNDVNETGGKRVAAEAEAAHGAGTAIFHRADVSNNADVAGLVAACLERFGRLDVMINNAGITHVNRAVMEVAEHEFDKIFAVNVKAIYLAAQHTVPVFRRQGGGVLINTASTAGLR